MSRNNSFDTTELESVKTAARFENYGEEICKLLDDKESKKHKKATKGSQIILKLIFGKEHSKIQQSEGLGYGFVKCTLCF